MGFCAFSLPFPPSLSSFPPRVPPSPFPPDPEPHTRTRRSPRSHPNPTLSFPNRTAATAGYIFTQTALKVHLAKASVNAQVLRDSLDKEGVERAWANEREGGAVGSGLEGLEDKYATTRGDH